jgi:hypothetical protein
VDDGNGTIGTVPPLTGTDRYTDAMGELWTGLSRTLSRLDVVASEPERLEAPTAADALRRLQYALHLAAEHAYGLTPPPGAASAHAELGDALACARDATAEVAEAASLWGAEGAAALLHEWRGALFRVRLARLRLAEPAPHGIAEPEPAGYGYAGPLAAFLLALLGAVAFVAGATLGTWPLWVIGFAAVCASVVAYRP